MAQTSGLTARGVPPQPVFLFYIKIAIIVLSVIILALSAWSISISGGGYYLGAPAGAFMIFVVCILLRTRPVHFAQGSGNTGKVLS